MSDEAFLDPKVVEEELAGLIEKRPIPVDEALDRLEFLHGQTRKGKTENLTKALNAALIETADFQGLLSLLSRQAVWTGDTPSFGTVVPSLLRKTTKDRHLIACVESAKFGTLKPTESFRRLNLLFTLKPGAFYFDKTWGFGIVKRLDDFYKRVVLDFTAKKNHAMSLEYAAETLAPVADDHLLARFHTTPDAIREMVAKNPGEIVKMALASFGDSTIARLQKLLDEYGIVPAKDWKPFWEGARAALKKDKYVQIPVKRSDPITVRATELAYDENWFVNELAPERNIPKLFEVISAYESEKGKPEITEAGRKILTDRLNFAIDGAFLCPPPMFTRLILMAQRLDIETPREELVEKLMDDDRFMEAGDKLSAKESEEMVRFILDSRPEAVGILLDKLPQMSFNFTCKTLDVLRANPDYLKAVQDRCRDLLASTSVPAPLLVWAMRNWDEVKDWGLPAFYELMEHAIAICEDTTLSGEGLRMRHLLHGFYADLKWFEEAFTNLNPLQREAIFYRVTGSTAVFEPALLKKLTDTMVRIEPELAKKKRAAREEKKEQPVLHYTSWRSLQARQEAFRHLVDVEIPRNREDIAYARGLGDLRENFEYQSAKDTQRVLLARREEMDAELQIMHGSYFAEAETDFSAVGAGVHVVLTRADGSELAYSILGEWDSDEALAILPNRSKLAVILNGKKVGDTATIPTVNGEEQVTVKAIEHLPEAVRAWIGTDAAATPSA